MATPRAASFRALNTLSQQSRRNLHITGVNSNPAATSALAQERHTVYLPQSLHDLRLECRKRNLKAAGSKTELVERLTGHDMLQSRAFSIAMKKINQRPLAARSPVEMTPSRHFNTSRALKAVGDSSTIDFAYLPMAPDSIDEDTSSLRVPILPDDYSQDTNTHDTIPEPVMKPEIYTVAMDSTHTHSPSAMSEVTDNHALDIDPYELTNTVRRAASGALAGAEEGVGTVKKVWSGFLDDLLGKRGASIGKA